MRGLMMTDQTPLMRTRVAGFTPVAVIVIVPTAVCGAPGAPGFSTL
jgi:hypothetical protein